MPLFKFYISVRKSLESITCLCFLSSLEIYLNKARILGSDMFQSFKIQIVRGRSDQFTVHLTEFLATVFSPGDNLIIIHVTISTLLIWDTNDFLFIVIHSCSRHNIQLAYWQRINANVEHQMIYSPERKNNGHTMLQDYESLITVIYGELVIFSLCWPLILFEWVPPCFLPCLPHLCWVPTDSFFQIGWSLSDPPAD
jgi:hypothetical protein